MATPTSNEVFFDLWRDFLQQSNGFWARAATVPKPPEPSETWQQFFGIWTDFWAKAFTQSPDTFQNAHKLWMEHLETTAKGLENVMGTEAYGTGMSKLFQEQLTWQEKLSKTANPQIDAVLRAMNLPSRGQMDRLFERVVGIEERLDDLEIEVRQLRRLLRHLSDPVGTEA